MAEIDIFDNNEDQLPRDFGDDVVQEVLKTGTDLRQYSRQIEKELKEVENESIQDYIKESQNIATLHNQITACDNILEKMESMLMSFQSDLGNISSEILSLQRKSVAMSQQLSNRQLIRGPLSQFIEDMTVSETLIAGIMDCPVTEKEFLIQLQTLNHKITFVKEQSFKEAKSCLDVKDILEKLKVKAMTKIRTYLLEQIYKFRKPMTNYQVPQNNMLKYKFFFEFILANERNVAEEICGEYIDTMSKIYHSYFKAYSSSLMKLQFEEKASKDDLMGVEDTVGRGLFHKTTLKHKGTVFSIDTRGEVLSSQLDAPIIIPHTASKIRYHYEALFRSEQYAIADNACREYLFLTEFFKVRNTQALDIFNQIMGKTLNQIIKNLQSFVDDCYDTIALFLCLHLVMRYQLMCHKRAVPALDNYWETLSTIIWPRFQHVFQLNIQSIKDCDPSKFNKETSPHYITRRYAEFSAAIISVVEGFPCEGATQLLAELREAVQCFLLRMAAIFPNRTQQLVFLINNYDLVIGVIIERTRDNSKEADSFREQLTARSTEFVEEVLSPHFGGIIQLVKESEALIEKGQADDLKQQEDKALAFSLVQSFTNNWKKALEEIHREVLNSFPSLLLGSALVQHVMTQFVQYYHRLHKILPPNARTQLTNIHHIMVEIKKYKTNY